MGRWVAGCVLIVGSLGLPVSASGQEPATAVVRVEFPNPEFVKIGYAIANEAGERPENSGGAVAGWSAGCSGLPDASPPEPLTVSVGAPLLDTGTEANDPGTYSIQAHFVGYCGFITDDARYEAAVATYPEGSTIPVTITVEFRTSRVNETYAYTGDVVVAPGEVIPVTLGRFGIDEASGAAFAGGTLVAGGDADEAEQVAGSEDAGVGAAQDDSTGPSGSRGLIVLLIGLVLGAAALTLAIGFIVRWRMGWRPQEAMADAAAAEGVKVSSGVKPSVALREAAEQLEPSAPSGEKVQVPKLTPLPPVPTAGFVSGVTYRSVEIAQPIRAFSEWGTDSLRAGDYLVEPAGGDGRTRIFQRDGTPLGHISNRDHPELRLQVFDKGLTVDTDIQEESIKSDRLAPGGYLVGPGEGQGAPKIYDATTGKELGRLNPD